jgi:hypothetical protein
MYQVLSRESTKVERTPSKQRWIHKPWQSHTRTIFIACAFVTVPMVAFTITMLCLVFSHRLNLQDCPYPELCHDVNSPDTLNGSNYYIDFPNGKLAFVSSLSATVSFTLVAAFMILYGFTAARQLLEASAVSQQGKDLPSPHDVAILVRLLNAEALLLWDLCLSYCRSLKISSSSNIGKRARTSQVVRACFMVMGVGLIGRSVMGPNNCRLADKYTASLSRLLIPTSTLLFQVSVPQLSRPWTTY